MSGCKPWINNSNIPSGLHVHVVATCDTEIETALYTDSSTLALLSGVDSNKHHCPFDRSYNKQKQLMLFCVFSTA